MGLGISSAYIAQQMKDLQGRFVRENRENRMDLAAYIDCVSSALREVAQALRQDKVPTYSLAKLKSYALQLPRVLGSAVDELHARDFALHITSWSGSAEDLLKAFQECGHETYDDYASAYEEAAGSLKALADGIRVTSDVIEVEEVVTAEYYAAVSKRNEEYQQMRKIDKNAKFQ